MRLLVVLPSSCYCCGGEEPEAERRPERKRALRKNCIGDSEKTSAVEGLDEPLGGLFVSRVNRAGVMTARGQMNDCHEAGAESDCVMERNKLLEGRGCIRPR